MFAYCNDSALLVHQNTTAHEICFFKKSFATKRQKYTPTTNLWKNTIVMFYQYFDKPSFVSLNCLPHSDGSFDIRNTTFQLLRIPNGSRIFCGVFFISPRECGLPWGVEWWKYWFCSFFLDMEMVCTWNHKSRLSKILHFLHRCCLFPRMPYFLAFWKRKNVYIQWFWCLQWILHYIVVHITICTYNHYLTNLLFFSQ